MDAETVASLLKGISVRQIRNYCKLGCPYEERERQRYFNWPAVLDWYVAFKSGGVPVEELDEPDDDAPGPGRKENQAQAMLRKTKAEADLKQLTLSKQRREVIPIADAVAKLERMLGNIRTQLLNMPPKLATRLAGERDPSAQETILKEELELLCRELAAGKVVGIDESEADDEPADDQDAGTDLQAADEDVNVDVDQVVIDFLLAHADAKAALHEPAE